MDTQNNTEASASTDSTPAPVKPAAKPPGRERTLSPACLKRAQIEYAKGKSCKEIANMVWCKVGASALYYHLSGKSPRGDGGVQMRRQGRKGPTLEQVDFAVSRFHAGDTLTAIRKLPELSWKVKGKLVHFAMPTLSKALKLRGCVPQRGRPAAPAPVEAPAAVAADAPVDAPAA
jgi:hypothetical protein